MQVQVLALNALAQARGEPETRPLVARVLGELVGRSLARPLGVLGGLIGVAQEDGGGVGVEGVEADADGGVT